MNSVSRHYAAVVALTISVLFVGQSSTTAQLFLSASKAFEWCTKSSSYDLTQQQLIAACEKTLKSKRWNETTRIWAHFKLGEAYRTLKDIRSSNQHLRKVVEDAGWGGNEDEAFAACAANFWLQDWKETVFVCGAIYEGEKGWRLALERKALALEKLGRYPEIIRLAKRNPGRLEAINYRALEALDKKREAQRELRRMVQKGTDIAQADALEKEQTVIAELKTQGSTASRFAVIVYCPSLDIIGTGVNDDPMLAAQKAYKDCVSSQLTPMATECCTLVAQTGPSVCVSLARNAAGQLFVGRNSRSSSAAKTATGKCGSDCSPVATKCVTDAG